MRILPLLLLLLPVLCAGQPKKQVNLYDSARHREVPLLVYGHVAAARHQPLAVVSHGYKATYDDHNFIAEHLVKKGYLVVSIQHEITGDPDMPPTGAGSVYEARFPFWQRGADNIVFVLKALQQRYPAAIDFKKVVLIGHSNGGDMSMLFARQHPAAVRAVISLDNRRMPFPRTARPRIFSIRSSDQPADSGVIPVPSEIGRYGMKVVKLPDTIHNDMSDVATPAQQAEMLRYIDDFLKALR
ncbi:alpha/beta hydrolase family protein [Chitinophaga lutea]